MTPTPVKQLDFLPEKYRQAMRRRRASYWRVVVVGLFVAVFAVAAGGMQAARRDVRAEHEQTVLRYNAAQQQEAELKAREARVAELRVFAELLTFLRHPWPRSQITARLFDPLPSSVTIDKLRIVGEPRPVTATTTPETSGEASAPIARSAATDLADLRRTVEALDVVVRLEGTTFDQPGLHSYLHRLTSGDLFVAAEVESIEAARGGNVESSSESPGASVAKFTVRIVVRPGWGLPGGPTLEELQAAEAAASTAATTTLPEPNADVEQLDPADGATP